MAATVIIGGTEYEIPELNFTALERSWPFVEKAMQTLDPITGVSAGISIIAAGLIEREEFHPTHFGIGAEVVLNPHRDRDEQIFELVSKFLKKKLKASEIDGVRQCVIKITEEAGLEPAKGEGEPAAETVSRSTETTIPTSPS